MNQSIENIEAPVSSGDGSALEPIATSVKGTVKWFHRVRGFGFITRDDTKEDIFCHYTSIKPMAINLRKAKKRLNLMDKEKVVFDIVKNKGNLEAINVVGKNGYYILDIIAYKREIQPYDLEIINDTRVTGKVKWFNVKIKYGFIHCDYNDEDVFVHASAIVKNNPDKFKPSLCEGEPVEFDILKRADGKLEAVNVSGPHGANVQGSRYSPDKTEFASISEGNTSTNKKYVETNLVGKVKWFNVKAGFGFINRNDNGQDVYAHHSAIVKKNPNHSVRSLADGELVQFNIVEGEKGLEAADITGVNGGPVQGSEYARPRGNDQPQRSRGRGSRSERSRGGSSVRQQRRGGGDAPNQQLAPPPPLPRRSASGGRNRSQQQQQQRGQRGGQQRRSAGAGYSQQQQAGVAQQASSRQLQQAPPPLALPPQQYGDVAAAAGYTYFNNRPNRYDSSPRYAGSSQQQGSNYAPAAPQQGAQMRGGAQAPPQQQYSSYANNHRGGGGYVNGAADSASVPPPLPHAFMPAPPPAPPQGPPMPPPQQQYDVNAVAAANNGAGYYNQRMPPLPPASSQNNYQYQAPSNGNGVLVDQRVPGFVKWYNFKNGYGFVTRSDNNQDIFVHKSGIQATSSSQPSLDDGEAVEFDVYQDGTRLLAINVTGPEGSILRGSKYASTQRMRPPNQNMASPSASAAAAAAGGGPAGKVYHRRKAN